jgi:hypothetical protein
LEIAMTITLNDERLAAFRAILKPLAEFRRVFGREVSLGFLAEVYAAQQFGLSLFEGGTEAGADGIDSDGKRCQIKYRDAGVLIDLNNFNFDYVVLVNLDAEYVPTGIWRLAKEQVQGLCQWREKFRKHQVSQQRFKNACLVDAGAHTANIADNGPAGANN